MVTGLLGGGYIQNLLPKKSKCLDVLKIDQSHRWAPVNVEPPHHDEKKHQAFPQVSKPNGPSIWPKWNHISPTWISLKLPGFPFQLATFGVGWEYVSIPNEFWEILVWIPSVATHWSGKSDFSAWHFSRLPLREALLDKFMDRQVLQVYGKSTSFNFLQFGSVTKVGNFHRPTYFQTSWGRGIYPTLTSPEKIKYSNWDLPPYPGCNRHHQEDFFCWFGNPALNLQLCHDSMLGFSLLPYTTRRHRLMESTIGISGPPGKRSKSKRCAKVDIIYLEHILLHWWCLRAGKKKEVKTNKKKQTEELNVWPFFLTDLL